MGKPDALWGEVPVYLRELDRSEFARDFVVPNPHPPQIGLQKYDENGIPLFSGVEIHLDPKFNEVMAWHEGQMREGIASAVRTYPNGMSIVPAEGFYLTVERYRTSRDQKGSFGSSVELRERVSGLSFGKRADLIRETTGRWPDIPPVFRCSDPRGFGDIGMDFNPYPDLFSRLAFGLPKAWEIWLKERRLKRWKPVPEWLVQVKASRGRGREPTAPAPPTSTA